MHFFWVHNIHHHYNQPDGEEHPQHLQLRKRAVSDEKEFGQARGDEKYQLVANVNTRISDDLLACIKESVTKVVGGTWGDCWGLG